MKNRMFVLLAHTENIIKKKNFLWRLDVRFFFLNYICTQYWKYREVVSMLHRQNRKSFNAIVWHDSTLSAKFGYRSHSSNRIWCRFSKKMRNLLKNWKLLLSISWICGKWWVTAYCGVLMALLRIRFCCSHYNYTMAHVGRMATIPTFSVVNKGVGYGQGILGGYFMTIDDQVDVACEYIIQILTGRPVVTLPIKKERKCIKDGWAIFLSVRKCGFCVNFLLEKFVILQ